MPQRTDPHPRRRRLVIALSAASVTIAALAGVGIYGLLTGPPTPSATPTETTSAVAPTPTADVTAGPTGAPVPGMPVTNDPEVYVRAVAQALFDWDTFTLLTVADHRAVLIEAADPTGIETPGLIADLDNYFPSNDTWRDLAEYRTRQHLQIDQVYVPEQWADAVTAAGGLITDDTHAYTVEGTRHRDGTWYDKPVSSAHPVAFTVFISCAPVFEQCHLLRLSEPDNPLR